MNETWVTVSGNVATDVTWRRTATGSVANFRLLSNERRFDGQSGTWRDGRKLGVRVTCWRALAENVRMSVTKGDPVVVHGKLYTSDYEQDGVRKYYTEIDASSVGLDLRKVCTKVVLVQDAETGEGHDPVDVSNLAVVPEDLASPPYDELDDAFGAGRAEPLGDELAGREALAG